MTEPTPPQDPSSSPDTPTADANHVAPGVPDVDGSNESGKSDVSRIQRAASAGQFVLRGLAISLPPILTLVIMIWIARGIYDYIISPASATVRYSIGSLIDESVSSEGLIPSAEARPILGVGEWLTNEKLVRDQTGDVFVRLGERAVPIDDYTELVITARPGTMPNSSTSVYMALAEKKYFGSVVTLNILVLACIVVILYFLGRFVTARIGTWFVHRIETDILGRLPVVRNVYGSVKQVTDFLFSESEVEYRRVVAIEYPRRGIWSLGLVTGESMLEVATAAGEPCVSVLIPSSPMPVTGYTISVPRSAIFDLDLSVDQAFQFCISCGVLVPSQQKFSASEFQAALTKRMQAQLEATTAANRHLASAPPPSNGDGTHADDVTTPNDTPSDEATS